MDGRLHRHQGNRNAALPDGGYPNRTGAEKIATESTKEHHMKTAHLPVTRPSFWHTSRTATILVGFAVAWSTLTPTPAMAQSAVWQPQGATNGVIYYNSGSVAIGTSAASALFTLGANANDGLRINNGTVNGVVFNTSNSAMTIGTVSSHPLFFLTGNTFRGVVTATGNFGIGTTNPQYKLAVNGTIGAQDIIVTNIGWPDYVFRPGYRLRSLSEVSQFIKDNGHLPDIPAEAEVVERGVKVGEMQAKLLAKVEELTLHLIQQDKDNRDMRDSLTNENRVLRERLARLERAAEISIAAAEK